MNEWIPIDREWPPEGEVVLACDSINQFVSLGRAFAETGVFEWMGIEPMHSDVVCTHWQLMPEAYQEDQDECGCFF